MERKSNPRSNSDESNGDQGNPERISVLIISPRMKNDKDVGYTEEAERPPHPNDTFMFLIENIKVSLSS